MKDLEAIINNHAVKHVFVKGQAERMLAEIFPHGINTIANKPQPNAHYINAVKELIRISPTAKDLVANLNSEGMLVKMTLTKLLRKDAPTMHESYIIEQIKAHY